MPKTTYFLALIVLLITSCQKEETIECWGVVRTVTTQKMYWNWTTYNNGFDLDIQEDTTFQCGITERELSKQCDLNSHMISDDGSTSVKVHYSFYPK